MSKMKKLYQEAEEYLIDKKNVIDILNNEEFKDDLGTEYTHIKNHFENNCIRYESIEEEEEENKDGK